MDQSVRKEVSKYQSKLRIIKSIVAHLYYLQTQIVIKAREHGEEPIFPQDFSTIPPEVVEGSKIFYTYYRLRHMHQFYKDLNIPSDIFKLNSYEEHVFDDD